ncbi:hypothetical protein [Methylococcus geothermalis]|uniref:Ferritin-like domain-containing protein n=1 Tax=Methylococcus geothermalis TaxID=2681310 RepID=A0A858Q9T9_9GAMM|nr:hypothetical protein [Methylococcus geothermalis]QJD30637.1 hypothetical protein GNH96_12050 [Methylococcus geothermalis]
MARGKPKAGSAEHRQRFCRGFIDSHLRFEPERLAWPALEPAMLQRLREVPFWQEVLYTEMRAIRIIEAFAPTIPDPLVREAMELMAEEERRHERLVRHLIARYGIVIEAREMPPLPSNIERTFIDFGYGECVDSFLGFGFFRLARESGFLPQEMFDVLEILMGEEVRHVLFFVNWMAWHEAGCGRGAAPLRALTSAWYYARAIGALAGVALRNARHRGNGREFSATQAAGLMQGFTVGRLLEACLEENRRRLDAYDRDLLRPRLLPALARIALGFTGRGGRRIREENRQAF